MKNQQSERDPEMMEARAADAQSCCDRAAQEMEAKMDEELRAVRDELSVVRESMEAWRFKAEQSEVAAGSRAPERVENAQADLPAPASESAIVSLEPHELLALLDSARALARLEAFLRSGPNRDAQAYTLSADEFAVTVDSPAVVRAGIRSDLASAIHAALDEAEARK